MPEFVSVPIIALAMPGDLERCLEAGATEYLKKSFSLEKLKAMMANLL
jgi:CheY-like chemotaxis protein